MSTLTVSGVMTIVMHYLHDHLLSAEECVSNKLARAQRHRLLPVCHDAGSSKAELEYLRVVIGAH